MIHNYLTNLTYTAKTIINIRFSCFEIEWIKDIYGHEIYLQIGKKYFVFQQNKKLRRYGKK